MLYKTDATITRSSTKQSDHGQQQKCTNITISVTFKLADVMEDGRLCKLILNSLGIP